MADNLVSLGAERDARRLIWSCACGCTALHHYADGGVECASCAAVATELSGEWRARLPPAPADPQALDGGNFKVQQLDSAATFLRRRLRDDADEIIVLVALRRDGGMATFATEIETAEQIEWLGRKIAEAHDRLLPRER